MATRKNLITATFFSAFGAFGQPVYQVLLDIPPGDSTRILAVVPSTDGATIAVFDDGVDSYVFRRFDVAGAHVWSKRVQSGALRNPWAGGGSFPPSQEWYGGFRPFQSDGQGGLFYCYTTLANGLSNIDGVGLDTSVTRTTILRMSPMGEIIRFDELRHELVLPADSIEPLLGTQHASMALYPDGGMLILEAYHSVWSQVIMSQITRLDPSGAVLWSKWYHLPGQPITQGTFVDMGQLCWMVTDTAGGAYLVDNLGDRIVHFNAQGQCEWVKSYFFDGGVFATSPGIRVDPVTNDLVMADDVGTVTGRKQTMIRISPLGELLDVQVYGYPWGTSAHGGEVMGMWPDGSTVVGDVKAVEFREDFTIIDPSGTTAHHYGTWPGADPDTAFVQYWQHFAIDEAHLMAAGTGLIVGLDLGNESRYAMLAAFDANTMGGCLRTVSQADAVPALSICTTASHATWLDVPAGQASSVIPLPAPTVVDISPPLVIDFCSLTVGVSELADQHAFSVRPTIAQEGDVVEVITTRSGTISMVASDGRQVHVLRTPAGRSAMALRGVASGAYAVTFTSIDGSVRATQRILVQ